MPTPLEPNAVRGRGPFAGDRRVVAPGAEVQEVRRIVLVQAECQVVVDGVVELGVAFEEARVLLREVAVDGRSPMLGTPNSIPEPGMRSVAGDRPSVEALSARIQITPDAEVEGNMPKVGRIPP